MIQGIQGSYASQALTPAPRGEASHPTKAAHPSGDAVDLSDSSKLMSSFFNQMGVDFIPGQPITLRDLEQGLERSEKELKRDMETLLLENGISLDPPVELSSDAQGNLRVVGEHPQKEAIEALLAENKDLCNDFHKTSALSSIVEAGKEYIEFSKAYARDPYGAVTRYSHLFNGLQMGDPFILTVGEAAEQAAQG